MPRRQLHPASNRRYQALKKLNTYGDPERFGQSADEFDRYVQYRKSFVDAHREDEINMVYSEAVESLLVEAFSMMIEATDLEPEYWAPKVEKIQTLFAANPKVDTEVMDLVERQYVPAASPSTHVRKAIYKRAQLEEMRSDELRDTFLLGTDFAKSS